MLTKSLLDEYPKAGSAEDKKQHPLSFTEHARTVCDCRSLNYHHTLGGVTTIIHRPLLQMETEASMKTQVCAILNHCP